MVDAAQPNRLATSVAVLLLAVFAVMAIGAGVLQWAIHHGPTPFVLAPAVFLGFPLVGALIIARRGSHPIGWILLATGILIMVVITAEDYAGYALVLHPGSLPFGEAAIVLNNMAWTVQLFLVVVLLPLLFPTGHLVSRRWLPLPWFAAVWLVAAAAGYGLKAGSSTKVYPQLMNPIGLKDQAALLDRIAAVSLIFIIIVLAATIAAVVVRYRASRGVERQQLKWFFFSFLLVPIPLFLNDVGPLGQISFIIVGPLVALSIGLAVLRYGLYDIEVVVSRTLVYGSLAVFITAVYVGIVVGIGSLVGSGGKPNLALSIIATAIVAVAFQPVRERLQKVANRLVYGKRSTPYEVLSQFSEHVAESYAADDVLPRMARVLADGTGAARADVWLRAGDVLRQAASWPLDAAGAEPAPVVGDSLPEILDTDRAVEVRHQGELLGALMVTKRKGESLTPVEETLLTDLAGQAGLVLKNVGLTAELLARLEELRASRQRLVAAQDEERRRLERNLHDGAQQNLVALKVKLGLAEVFAERDPEKAKQLLGEIKSDADEALETLRDLARGIYPPLLADKGLVAAFEAQARKATLPVSVEADGIGRYPPEIEAAVYFCVLEALQNVQKYADAHYAVVRLRVANGGLRVEVEDEGRGFDPAGSPRGSGLQNMEDRLDAIGGALEIASSPGLGTVVSVTVPSTAPAGVT